MIKANRYTPLRYPGGKAKFAPFVKKLCDEFNLLGGHYAEPYAGGAGVALDMLFSGYCTDIHINDADSAIYCFWYSVIYETENLLKLIVDTPVSIEEWHKHKYILETPKDFTVLQHGFSTFFLNRTNRSGIVKGGVIGGKEQKGIYKLDARFNKESLIKRIEKIASYSTKIHVSNLDAMDFLKDVDRKLPKNSLIYLDPPYYKKGQGLYRNFYEHDDHIEIKNLLNRIKNYWIVSYDNCEEIRIIYQNYMHKEYMLNYSANKKIKGSEVVFFCDALSHAEQIKIA